jgi:hypothetical protein
MPDTAPVIIPHDIEGVWNEWGSRVGLEFMVTYREPSGLCIAVVDLERLTHDGYPDAHSVVWKEGSVIWNPDRYVPIVGDPKVKCWIDIRTEE